MTTLSFPAFDCHFHTTQSDWLYTPEQAVEEASRLWLEFVGCTNHDVIDRHFVTLAQDAGIDAVQATEISVRDTVKTPQALLWKNERSIHMTTFCKDFSNRVDVMLDSVLAGRRQKVALQLAKLRSQGFSIDDQDFSKYWELQGMNLANVGNGHIAKYLFSEREDLRLQRQHNLEIYTKITGKKECVFRDFIVNHLKSEGEHPFWAVQIPEYEPTLEHVAQVLGESRTIRSIAHSHLNYESVDPQSFVRHVRELVRRDCINALEIHASAPPAWVELYCKIRKQTNIFLTFGSDCHFEGKGTPSHAWLGTLNPHVDRTIITAEYHRFREYLEV